MLLDELAKELVEGTSALVGGRTINIMSPEGIIVASTEKDRIGSYHQGAREAAQTGKVVNIYSHQLARYPGAKEGCNMPLRLGGSIIGVVGIYGDPDQIQDVAHLLEVYATKYYQLEAMLRPHMAESTMRMQLLLNLLSHPGNNGESTHSLLEKLNIVFRFPVSTLVISPKAPETFSKSAERIHQLLDGLEFQRKSCDLWGIVENRMVLLCSACSDRDIRRIQELNAEGYRVSLGMPSNTLYDIPAAYEQASTLDEASPLEFSDIQRQPVRCCYMLRKTAVQESAFLEAMYQQLMDTYGQSTCRILLDSIEAYYDCGRSVTAAARQQFIHKNTLQYRVKRVLETLELTELSDFSQEYLVRLLLEHSHRKSGS